MPRSASVANRIGTLLLRRQRSQAYLLGEFSFQVSGEHFT